MKENQKAIFVLAYIIVISLVLEIGIILISNLVLIYDSGIIIFLNWFEGFNFAIFTSSLLSFIISLINYKLILKKNVEKIVFDIYQLYICLYSTVFNEEKKLNIKLANEVTRVYTEKVCDIYSVLFELTLLKFYKKSTKESLYRVKSVFIEQYNFFAYFDKFVYDYENEFKDNCSLIYKMLMEKIEDETLYDESKKLARKLGGQIFTPDEFANKEKVRAEMSLKFRKLLEEEKERNKM